MMQNEFSSAMLASPNDVTESPRSAVLQAENSFCVICLKVNETLRNFTDCRPDGPSHITYLYRKIPAYFKLIFGNAFLHGKRLINIKIHEIAMAVCHYAV